MDIPTEDAYRILNEMVKQLDAAEVLAIGDIDSILREELNNDVITAMEEDGTTFDDTLAAIVKDMIPAGIMSYGGVYEELSEHFNNEIIEKWEEEQS